MQSAEYQKLALVTESKDFDAIKKRVGPAGRTLALVLNMGDATAESQDALKKHIFYGKELSMAHLMQRPENVAFDSEESIQARLSAEENIRLIHGAIGVMTEAGELQQQISNHLFHGKALDKVNLAEEVGDTLWYCAILLDALGTTFGEVMATNIAKLQTRFPAKFEEARALNRDLVSERKILENNND